MSAIVTFSVSTTFFFLIMTKRGNKRFEMRQMRAFSSSSSSLQRRITDDLFDEQDYE